MSTLFRLLLVAGAVATVSACARAPGEVIYIDPEPIRAEMPMRKL